MLDRSYPWFIELTLIQGMTVHSKDEMANNFLTLSDAQNSETRLPWFHAKERTWLKKWYSVVKLWWNIYSFSIYHP